VHCNAAGPLGEDPHHSLETSNTFGKSAAGLRLNIMGLASFGPEAGIFGIISYL
jgi:hypothetical protein